MRPVPVYRAAMPQEKNPPKISIVTPSFNQGRFIEQAILSVAQQDYPSFEHIIIDNCSTDETLSILEKYPHVVWVSEPDQGQSDALNKGFKRATGDYVGWLNADDYYLPGCFRQVADFMEKHEAVDVAYGNFRAIDAAGNVLEKRRELPFDLFMLKYLHVLYIPTTATFFRRKVFDEGNFIDIAYRYSMDYEFFLRLALAGYRFGHLDAFLADFRWHEDSKSTTAAKMQDKERHVALYLYDPFLRGMSSALRPGVHRVLEWTARAKRYFLKGIRGYYFSQWSKGKG
ncbi:glycosyltransferase family 2 protein [Rhodocaloribacter sp.]